MGAELTPRLHMRHAHLQLQFACITQRSMFRFGSNDTLRIEAEFQSPWRFYLIQRHDHALLSMLNRCQEGAWSMMDAQHHIAAEDETKYIEERGHHTPSTKQ